MSTKKGLNRKKYLNMIQSQSYRTEYLKQIEESETFYTDESTDLANDVIRGTFDTLYVHGVKVDMQKVYEEDMFYIDSISERIIEAAKNEGVDINTYITYFDDAENLTSYQRICCKVLEYIIDYQSSEQMRLGSKVAMIMEMIETLINSEELLDKGVFIEAIRDSI